VAGIIIRAMRLVTALFGVAVAFASQPPGAGEPLPAVTLQPALARVLTDYEAAWRARDAAALARLFADDRVVVPNSCPPVKGRARVQECYANSGGPLALRAIASNTDGALAYIIGAYAEKEGGPDLGKFTLTLAKGSDGRWLIVADMDRPYPKR
jgi:ketosteroid isomerase-like protein